MSDTIRFFKAANEQCNLIGRYTGTTPKQAASKASISMIRKLQQENKQIESINIYLYETTRGQSSAIFGFQYVRTKLDTSQSIIGGGKTITYYYKNTVNKIDVPDYIRKFFMEGIMPVTEKDDTKNYQLDLPQIINSTKPISIDI